MKTALVALTVLLLAPAAALADSAPETSEAPAAERASGACEAAGPAAVPAKNPLVGTTPEALLLAAPRPQLCDPYYPQGIDCQQLNDQYCTYAWNYCRGCCEATWVAPGAYCPDICQ